jgi:heme/copper-type cytochrome/quinol oxidase subunit 2
LGFFIGQSVFDKKHKISIYFGLFVAIILHGLYDAPLMYLANIQAKLGIHEITQLEIYSLILFLVVFVVSIFWTLSIVKRLRKRQEKHKSQIL